MHNEEKLYDDCLKRAVYLKDRGYPVAMSAEALADLLYKLEEEKIEKNKKTDNALDYNDEIVSIEEMGDLDTVDISVSGDNLFYCNNILTKNSFGLPATADLMFSAITSENLDELGQISIKQLKNRYNDPARYRRFVLNVDKSRMRLSDCHDPEGGADRPVMDNTEYGERQKEDDQMQFVTKRAGRKDFSGLMS